jgi:hypothetical protein
MYLRVPKEAEFTLVRVIDPLVHRRRAVPVLGLLAVAAAFSRRFTSCLCAYHRGQAHDTPTYVMIHKIEIAEELSVFIRYLRHTKVTPDP